MARVEEILNSQRSHGPATILAFGTATPSNCVNQADYPDFYFRITNSEHMTDLKEKFKRICEKSMIKKRYLHLTEQFLRQNPNMCTFMAPSLDVRQDILAVEVPKLGKQAAVKAIHEWGQQNPRSPTFFVLLLVLICLAPIFNSPSFSGFHLQSSVS